MECESIRKRVYQAISWSKFFIEKKKERNEFIMLIVHINESRFHIKSLLESEEVNQ